MAWASLPADGSSTVSPVTTTTYVLTATGPGGSVTASVTITVNPVPAVDSFTAAPATITAGQSATLSWTTTNADSVSIDGGASLPADGSSTVSPVTTTTYVLTATGPGGSVTASVNDYGQPGAGGGQFHWGAGDDQRLGNPPP